MKRQARYGMAAAGLAALLLSGCGTSSTLGSRPEAQAPMAPVTTAEGIQQFAVPANGRALFSERLHALVPGPILEAKISNAWRTAASAQTTPDDYAACVSAVTAGSTQTFMIVKSGGGRGAGTGDVVRGADAAKRCSDPGRVVQWLPLDEAVASR